MLERQLNAALVAQLPQRLLRAPQDVAIDFHDRPYYGKQSQDTRLWVRSCAKDGTTHFYRIATAYVMHRGLRLTVALRFVLPKENAVTVVQDLLNRLQVRAIRVHWLFLDKGFAGIGMQKYLTQRRQPALIACPLRGKHGGTRGLCTGHKSYRTTHTFVSAEHGAFTVPVAVCRVFTTAKRTKRLKRRAVWMVFIVLQLDLSPHQALRVYRRCFGIESSYRVAGKVRGWTTSPNAAYRFVLLVLSFSLLNLWMHLRWLYAQLPRRAGRKLATCHLQLYRFTKFVLRALDNQHVAIREIAATAVPLS